MPNIDSRAAREKAFGDRVAKVFRTHQRRVVTAGGAAVDWEKFEEELRKEIREQLLMVFLLAALLFLLVEIRKHRDIRDESEVGSFDDSARRYADRKSSEIARKMADTTRRRVAKVAQDVARLPTRKQTGELRKQTDGVFGAKRAQSAAVTITTEAVSAGEGESRRRVEQLTGNRRRAFWITSRDDRVCPICQPLHMKPQEVFGAQYPDGPPAHPNCILPGQESMALSLVGAAKSFYDGPCIEITFRSGRRLAVTQDHRIGTDRGWVRACRLAVGMDCIRAISAERVALFVDPNNDEPPVAIEDKFDSLSKSASVVSGSMPSSAEQLDGETMRRNGQVDVVNANRSLRVNRIANRFEQRLQPAFAVGLSASSFPADSLTPFFGGSHCSPSCGFMRGRDLMPALSLGHPRPLYGLRLGSRTEGRPVGLKQPCQKTARDAESVRQSIDRLTRVISSKDIVNVNRRSTSTVTSSFPRNLVDSGHCYTEPQAQIFDAFSSLIFFDKITSLSRFQYRGHVYDLQDAVGEMFFVNDIIVHNCRCFLLYRVVREVA